LIIHGHTHRYREESLNDIIFFNPGESAGSLEGKNALGIINLDSLEIRRIFF
jgi:predicted phosphodiesterase